MRITHVIVTDAFAGTERYVVEVATEQARRGHDVAVIGGAAASMPGLLPEGVRWAPGSATRQALEALVRGGRRDIVHSHITKADFVALMAAPRTGGRRYSTRHITAARGYGRVARVLAPLVRRGLTAEIAVSEFVAGQLTPRPDVVLLNGVTPQPAAGGGGRTVLMAHRLAPEKDTTTGLRAWAACGLADDGWRLVVAGDGPERAQLTALAAELGVSDSTTFTGWLADPAEAFGAAEMLLAPAPAEPCGLSILEAMAIGLPVVAAGSGGNLETVGPLTGAALFPPGDAAAAGAQLRRLSSDDDARRAYGLAGQERQRTSFTLTGHVDRLMAVYAG